MDRLEIEKFKAEMSRWEGARKRFDRMASRDPAEEGD